MGKVGNGLGEVGDGWGVADDGWSEVGDGLVGVSYYGPTACHTDQYMGGVEVEGGAVHMMGWVAGGIHSTGQGGQKCRMAAVERAVAER